MQGKIGYVMKIVVLDDQNGDFCMRIMLNGMFTCELRTYYGLLSHLRTVILYTCYNV